MKDALGGFGLIVAGIVLFLGLSLGGVYFYYHYIEPQAINQHAVNIKHSVNYVDGHNEQARALITEYYSAQSQYEHDAGDAQLQAGDQAHMNALLLNIRQLAAELDTSEIAPDVAQFLAANPGP